MSGVLIDTNIYSLAMRGDPQVVDTLRAISHIGFSVISAGELLSGFKGGNREAVNRSELNPAILNANDNGSHNDAGHLRKQAV